MGGAAEVGMTRAWRGWSRPVRLTLTALAVLVIAFAVTVTAYRTLKPADTANTATEPLPSPASPEAVQYGELAAAPLIVEGRLRIYAEQRRVYADTPVTATRVSTPFWSFRRWPAEVLSVVSIEKSAAGGSTSVVVTKWSDSMIVALDASTGKMIWQQRVESESGQTFDGRRDGANTVYRPIGIFTSASSVTHRPVLIVNGKNQAVGFDPWTGKILWTQIFTAHPTCHTVSWTGPTTYLAKDSCAAPAILEIFDAGTGRKLSQWRPPGASIGRPNVSNWYLQPASCELGASNCALFKAAATGDVVGFAAAADGLGKLTPSYYKAGPDGRVTPQPHADKDIVFSVGDNLIKQVSNDYVWNVSAGTGKRLWMSEVAGRLIAADTGQVYLINAEYQLLVLDLQTGAVTSSTELRIRPDDKWVYQQTYLHDGYLAVERLQSVDSDVDDRYYFSAMPVVLVGV
jgi:outer membrane protein assembly factor BamB